MTRFILCAGVLWLSALAAAETNDELREQVRQTEISFAKTMADRDAAAFASFLSKEAIFVSGARVSHGPDDIAARWKAYFNGPQAPFSWEPEQVQVLNSGALALTSGPVRDPSGRRIGTFNSVWRREGKGRWRIVFDNGCPACDCAQ